MNLYRGNYFFKRLILRLLNSVRGFGLGYWRFGFGFGRDLGEVVKVG